MKLLHMTISCYTSGLKTSATTTDLGLRKFGLLSVCRENFRRFSFAGYDTRAAENPDSQAIEDCNHSYRDSRMEQGLNVASGARVQGSIHVIVGPMFAGKTTELLRRVAWEKNQGRSVELVKSTSDNRYATSAVVSHDGLKLPCSAVSDMGAFQRMLGNDRFSEVDVIAVDEAQFIKGIASWCRMAADIHHKTVIVAGLDGDFRREKFGELVDMIPFSDTVTKLSARCGVENCSQRAHFTFRRSLDTEKEVVGGSELYLPVCRGHYLDRMRTMESMVEVEKQFKSLRENVAVREVVGKRGN